jgi:cytochrome c-type biogenesis protein CcmH/NrfG
LGLLVGLYVETGASEQAKAIFEKTCKISVPLALATVRDQVQSLLDQHEFQTAMELLRIGIDAQPENTDLHGLLGDLYMKLDRPRDALTSYENITRLGRPMPANYCRLARVYLALGFHLRAEKAVQQALHLDPECQEAAELRVAVAR